ncbi:MAG: 5-formyltetrahydrofolate cyclo-ligase [Clostridium sp.]|nr:5-formyltetrahydrofolate cyclo-ligase [Acetatifactor muris]MCM1527662.1 5-formyltetrahydrofolate cyclo-ligase [Bacteroides sp.]MCM1563394.1 5-formyltetrahydrofolate cyclo-ligase [Clostridium sp.]
MNMDERIRRINELYHKSQAEGLTEAEKTEQAALRREYVESVKQNLRANLDSIRIRREDGTLENPGEIRRLREEKKALRKQILQLREELSAEDRERAALLLAERILGHQWYYLSDAVLAFAGYGSEIGTDEILRETIRQGKALYLPKVEEDGIRFYRVRDLAFLKPGYKGIREPLGDTERYEYDTKTAECTLLLMPGVAFDGERNRMGYGGGFYDRFLSDKPQLALRAIGVGHACQMVEKVPAGERDIRPYQVICV